MHKGTVTNWELGHSEPALRHMPGVIRLLGYVPFEPGGSLPERVRAYRMIHGISRKELAGMLRVDEDTLWRWETEQRRPARNYAERIERVISFVPTGAIDIGWNLR